MIIGMAQKQPAEYLDYNVDFTEWMPEDDEIAEATVTVLPDGELTADTISIMTPIVKFWAAGGVTGKPTSSPSRSRPPMAGSKRTSSKFA